jgi:Sulfotransferase family
MAPGRGIGPADERGAGRPRAGRATNDEEHVTKALSGGRTIKRTVNDVLSKAVGYRLTRARSRSARRHVGSPPTMPGDRLLITPTFLLSSVRSGSTLLRVILNSHSQIHAPHELHLQVLRVKIARGFAQRAMGELRLDERGLEHLLWDRLLHRELTASGKRLIVDKTPNNVFIWQRLPEAWPDARFIFLLRHPAAIADSLFRATKDPNHDQVVSRVLDYGNALEEARRNLQGLTVTYEDLVTEPERVVSLVCDFLGVPWEPEMLNYGDADHGPFQTFLGDWSDNIRSGKIQPNVRIPEPGAIPPRLMGLCRAWGYSA